MLFAGKIVIVTGAGNGIGRIVARRYAEHGASVVIVDKDEEQAVQTARQITEAGGTALVHAADMRNADEITHMIHRTVEQFGRIDILINNAGISVWKSPYELTPEEWDSVLGTNLRGTFLCSREAAKIMKKHGGGSIVNLSSTRAQMSEPNSEAYAASKGGILSLTHALAVSLGPDRIRVNAISPGWIETGDYDQLREIDHLQHPAGRVGNPDDIARACIFLTNPENDFITGENLVIDGGMTRKMMYEE